MAPVGQTAAMAERQNVSGGGPLEAVAGYSRAVRIGNHVSVAGTTTLTADGALFPGDCYRQTQETLAIMGRALNEAGASFADVVRTRAFITDVSMAEDFMRAHGEVFADIRPAATLVEVSALVHPDLVIEIEIDAVLG